MYCVCLKRAVDLTVETTDPQRRSWMTSGTAGGDCHFRTHRVHLDIYNTLTTSKTKSQSSGVILILFAGKKHGLN
jgi:hypothetical protein